VYRGSGAPSSGLGVLNELYIDDVGLGLYEKQIVPSAVPAYRSHATATAGVGSPVYNRSPSVTVNKPAGTVAGDVLIAAVYTVDAAASINALAGWTRFTPIVTGGSGPLTIFTRVADGTEGSSFTFVSAVDSYLEAVVICYSGGSGIDVSASGQVAAAASMDAPSVTTTIGHDRIVSLIAGQSYGSGSWVDAPAGYTKRVDFPGVVFVQIGHVAFSDFDKPTTGPTGPITIPATGGVAPIATPAAVATFAIKNTGSVVSWVQIGSIAALATDPLWDTKGDLAVATGPDAASKLAVGSNAQVLTADSAQPAGVKWAAIPAGGMTKLFDSTVVGADAAIIDTGAGGIPGGYAVLQAFLYGRTDDTGGFGEWYWRFNNDSGANYDWQRLYGADTTVSASKIAGDSGIDTLIAGGALAANYFGMSQITIPNYDGAVGYKFATLQDGYIDSGNQRAEVRSGAWRSTAPITRLSISPLTGGKKLKVGSRLVIFGLG
jgi:hypothetical protein